MSGGDPVRESPEGQLRRASMVLGWNEDAGNLGGRVTDYLNRKLAAKRCAEIDPEDYFSLAGVVVKGDVARCPHSEFYICEERHLIVLRSDPPESEWYSFLNTVLDVAERTCDITELYVVGAMVNFGAHTVPRQLFSVVNSPELKAGLARYDLIPDMDYETPPGERPTLNSFLLWIAKARKIRGMSLWVPVPFYLAQGEDPEAEQKVLGFLDERLCLSIDFSDLDREVLEQNEGLARARSSCPEIDDYIGRLERDLMLTDEENGDLIRKIGDALKEGG